MLVHISVDRQHRYDRSVRAGRKHGFASVAARVLDSACTPDIWRSSAGLLNLRLGHDANVVEIGDSIEAQCVGDRANPAAECVHGHEDVPHRHSTDAFERLRPERCQKADVRRKTGEARWSPMRSGTTQDSTWRKKEDVSETIAVMTDNPGELKGVASRAKGVSYGLEGVVTHDLTQVSIEEAFGKTDLKMSGADSSKFIYDHHADEERKRVIE